MSMEAKVKVIVSDYLNAPRAALFLKLAWSRDAMRLWIRRNHILRATIRIMTHCFIIQLFFVDVSVIEYYFYHCIVPS